MGREYTLFFKYVGQKYKMQLKNNTITRLFIHPL